MAHLGVDPGTKNIGVAITDDEGKLLASEVLSIEECSGLDGVANKILCLCDEHSVTTCAIERFVPFKGIYSKASEEILMLIGCLWYALTLGRIKITLYRSIEWKPALCKYLVKETGFNNPSTSFDKLFSKAAAEKITKEKIKNDHIADGIGLSRMWAVSLQQTK